MNAPQKLEQRMQDLGRYLAGRPEALALLGLGSAGLETDRLDEWSDLDFFVIVAAGHKQAWVEDPSWLAGPAPLAYTFKNTPDGYKLLWEDGVFGEMAVFEAAELAGMPYAEGRVVWARDGFDTAVLKPVNTGGRRWQPPSVDYLAGELLTCLYVGLCRWHRGERLSAWRFIQSHCLDRYLEITEFLEPAARGHADPYSRDRRFEQLYPTASKRLERFLTGYADVKASALALLDWLEGVVEVNAAMAREIRAMAGQG